MRRERFALASRAIRMSKHGMAAKQACYGSRALGSSSLSSIFSRVVRDFAYFTRSEVISAN